MYSYQLSCVRVNSVAVCAHWHFLCAVPCRKAGWPGTDTLSASAGKHTPDTQEHLLLVFSPINFPPWTIIPFPPASFSGVWPPGSFPSQEVPDGLYRNGREGHLQCQIYDPVTLVWWFPV